MLIVHIEINAFNKKVDNTPVNSLSDNALIVVNCFAASCLRHCEEGTTEAIPNNRASSPCRQCGVGRRLLRCARNDVLRSSQFAMTALLVAFVSHLIVNFLSELKNSAHSIIL
ncbi:MAG: hypothetical protein LBE13_04810 [Bacteroidales bacterium]|nr:hypothetical protein [Bacteroidales bacterium]